MFRLFTVHNRLIRLFINYSCLMYTFVQSWKTVLNLIYYAEQINNKQWFLLDDLFHVVIFVEAIPASTK